MLGHAEIEAIFTSRSGHMLTELRQATQPVTVSLSSEMAASLGTPTRRLTPFLGVVVDVIASKLEVDEASITAGRVKVSKELQKYLGDNAWSLTERELYSAVVRDGEAYVLTTWTADGPKYTVREAYNGMCGASVVTADDVPVYGFNVWKDGSDNYADFYYPDCIEKYRKGKDEKSTWEPRTDAADEAWPVAWVDSDGNPLGIALTCFDIGDSDIIDAVQIARDMNEALLDLVANSRTQGWPQRWLRGQKNASVLTNDLGQPLISSQGMPIRRTVHAAPGSIMLLSAESEMGQLAPAAADATLLTKLLEILSFITTVPTHYFSGEWPSGVALIQSESRLNHKIEAHQGRLTSPIVAMLRLAMRLNNHFAGTAYDTEQPITIPWHSPEIETEDLKQGRKQATEDSLTKLVASGLMTKATAVRELHRDWSEEQITAELATLSGVPVDTAQVAL